MSGHSAHASQEAFVGDGDRASCYLLFAGSHHSPRGGLGDLVGAFTSEAAAREAFRHIRLNRPAPTSWAQLAVVDGFHGIRPLSWFGIGATPTRTFATFARPPKLTYHQRKGGMMQVAIPQSQAPIGLEVEPFAQRHPVKRVAGWLVGIVAIGAIGIGVFAGDGGTRPVPPKPPTVDAGSSTNGSVVPFTVRAPDAVDGVSSADG